MSSGRCYSPYLLFPRTIWIWLCSVSKCWVLRRKLILKFCLSKYNSLDAEGEGGGYHGCFMRRHSGHMMIKKRDQIQICMVLFFQIVVLQHVSGWFKIAPEAHFWSMRLAVVNSLVNPLIGAAMCKPYRTGYLFLLCKFLHCCGLCSSYKAESK